MLRRTSLFLIIALIFIFGNFLAAEELYAQRKMLPAKPTLPSLPSQKGVWKIVRFLTKPQCYTTSPTRDVPIEIRTTFECKGETCEDLTLKFYWQSNIERFTRKVNLTQAIKSFCRPQTPCKVRFDGDVLDVKIGKRALSIRKTAYVSPNVKGEILMVMKVFTGITPTDRKRISLSPCGYDARVDFSYASTGYIRITITDLDKAGAGTINAFVETSHPAFTGQVTFTEDTTNFGVFSRVQPFIWTQGVSCKVTYIDERTSSGRTNVRRVWNYVVP